MENQLPDAFTDTKRVTKSHIPAENVPVQIEIPKGKPENKVTHEITTRLKRGRPLGSKNKNPRKRKGEEKQSDPMVEESIPVEIQNEKDREISINYANTGILWNRKENINDAFSYSLACEVMDKNNGDPEPQSVTECKNRHDWTDWKKAIDAELDSLDKCKVFGPIVLTPEGVRPVGYKWVFVRKRNEKNEIVRYKARLVAQGFSQRPGIDFEETYSPVMDGITFRYLINLAVHEKLKMHLMDIVTAYLYGSLDTNIYMKIPEGFKMPAASSSMPRERYSIKLERSLYGLKQSNTTG
ncbi:unnamed protein product [Rhodiola kirilowii]